MPGEKLPDVYLVRCRTMSNRGEAALESSSTTAPGLKAGTNGGQWRRRAVRLLVFVLLYYAIFVYPVLRLLGLLFPDWHPGTPALLAILVSPVAGRLARQFYPGRAARALSTVTDTWVGVCFVLLIVVLVFEVTNLWLDLPARPSGLVVCTIATVLVGLGFLNAHRVRVRDVHLPTQPSSPAVHRRFVQLSDVHVGSRGPGFLRRVVARCKSLEPSALFITGDFIDLRAVPREHFACLAELDMPVFFVAGNHERYVDLEAIVARLGSLGVRVLRNESVVDGDVQIIGIEDAEPRDTVARELSEIEVLPDKYTVLLYHRPHGLEAAAASGIQLMLSGHTHNGQIVPFNFLVKRIFERIHGLYRYHDAHLYVSPGTGTWGPLIRLGSCNEITHLHVGGGLG